MSSIRKILVPVDFSRFSDLALDYGCELAQKMNAELHLLHVRNELSTVFPTIGLPDYGPGEYLPHQPDHTDSQLNRLPTDNWRDQLSISRAIRMGSAASEIVRYAETEGIDVVVIGTHGRSGLKHVLLGSVAERVVRHAGCPVLTVRPSMDDFEAAQRASENVNSAAQNSR